MGIVANELVFQGKPPSMSQIMDTITELSGLSLLAEPRPVDTSASGFFVYLSFSCLPKNRLEIDCVSEVEGRGIFQESFKLTSNELREPVSGQTVHLRIDLGQEPTLFYMAVFALEALGGSLKHPLSEKERSKYLKPLTSSKLKQRTLHFELQIIFVCLLGVILLPLLIPLWLLQFFVFWLRFIKTINEIQNDLNNS
jgi:hypothetical protein